jgi:hypothetical protein
MGARSTLVERNRRSFVFDGGNMAPSNPYAPPAAITEDPNARLVADVEPPTVRRAARLAGVVLMLLTVAKGTDVVPRLWRFLMVRPIGGASTLLAFPLGAAALYGLLFVVPAVSFLRGRLRYRGLAIGGHLLVIGDNLLVMVMQVAAGWRQPSAGHLAGQLLSHVAGLTLIVGRPGRARFWIGLGLLIAWVLAVVAELLAGWA